MGNTDKMRMIIMGSYCVAIVFEDKTSNDAKFSDAFLNVCLFGEQKRSTLV